MFKGGGAESVRVICLVYYAGQIHTAVICIHLKSHRDNLPLTVSTPLQLVSPLELDARQV